MNVSEKIARTSMCPVMSSLSASCVASGCMAWRWDRTYPGDGLTSGYCGLAGKP